MKKLNTTVDSNKSKKSKKEKKKKVSEVKGNTSGTVEGKKMSVKTKIKQHISKHKKEYARGIITLVAILAIIGAYIGIRNLILHIKYAEYEEKMELYGLSLMYDNQTAKSYQRVTKNEMVRIILSSIYNEQTVDKRGFTTDGEFYGDEWIELAEAAKIVKVDYITKENFKKLATRKDALKVYLDARSILMDKPVSSNKEASFKNLNSFNEKERTYINDAVENGLIENEKGNLKLSSKMIKGEFNMLVVKFVEKYNTIAPDGEELVLKEESKPKNASIYPYILYSVDKAAYEYKGINEGGVDYKNPSELYKYKKEYYSQVDYKAEQYYNAILNVDYRNINKEAFFEKTNEFLRYDYSEQINKYVDYVKENEIVIEGKATVQFPIFYLDGVRFRARIKLDFEIKNSKTDKNILLGDTERETDITYKNKKYVIYIDAPMGTTILSKALLLDMEPVIDLMVSDAEASNKNEI